MADAFQDYIAAQSRSYLEHVRRLVARKDVWALTIEQDEALLEGIRALDYSREHVSGGTYHDNIVDILERLEQNRAQHSASMAELVDIVDDAQRRIGQLSPPHARLLLHRYVDDLPWQDVGERLGYSMDYCRKELHHSALVEMHDHLPTEWRDPRHRAI